MMLSISFDDGWVQQLKWARCLFHNKIQATVYVNGSNIGQTEYLTVDHLKRIQNEFGHMIANHLWTHSCPKAGLTANQLVQSAKINAEWLHDNGFTGGEKLVAIPFGRMGGGWSHEHLQALLEWCDQIRDVSPVGLTSLEEPMRIVNALCDNVDASLSSIASAIQQKALSGLCLHHDLWTPDPHFLRYLDRICDMRDAGELRIVSNKEILEGVYNG